MKSLIAILICALSLTSSQARAQASDLFQTPGMAFFTPEQFYKGQLSEDVYRKMPEHAALNADVHAESNKIMQFLMGEGISMGFGVNSNRDSYFDLYGNISVDVELDYPAPGIGYTPESDGGKRYFPDHDAMHLWALRGVGPRKKDLANRKQNIERWAKVLMDAEGLATAYNAAYQVKTYWDWRFRNSGASEEEIKKFESANRGVMTGGTWDYAGFLDTFLTTVRGEPIKQMRLLNKYLSWEKFKEAKESGVPQLLPPLDKYVGAKGEEFTVKNLLSPIVSIGSFFRYKSGYLDLIRATRKLLEYYYSDFYVEWADTFHIGEDIDSAETNVGQRLELFRHGKVLSDVVEPARGRNESQVIRNLLTQTGRKLIELKHFSKIAPQQFKQEDLVEIEARISDIAKLNDQLIEWKNQNREVSDQELAQLRKYFHDTNTHLAARFPIDRYVPNRYRLGYADYEKFWTDPFALILDRQVVLDKFVSVKGVWKEALKQRLAQAQAEKKGDAYQAVDEFVQPQLVDDLTKQMAARFNRARKGDVVAEGKKYEDNYYLNRVEIFRHSFLQQIENYSEQVKEFQHLSYDERLVLVSEAESFRDILDKKILTFKQNYQSRFLDLNRDPKIKEDMWQSEGDIKWAMERSFVAMINILDLLDQGKVFSKLTKNRDVIKSNGQDIADGKLVMPSLLDMIRKVTPMKKGLLKTVCSGVMRICMNQDLTKIIKETPADAYVRNPNQPAVYTTVKENGERSSEFPKLPKDAIIFFTMNHDHAALDARYLMEIANKLGVDKNLILTTAFAWPQFEPREMFGKKFSIFKNKDPYLALKEEQNPTFKERALQFFRDHPDKRVAFSIFPEGELAFWGVQFPLLANWGAYKLARRAAIEWAGKRPVYIVEAHANFLRVVTANKDQSKDQQVKIDIIEPKTVPTTPISDNDPWMAEQREAFERRANDSSRRGEMYDMIDRKLIKDGRINTTEAVRRYIPAREAMAGLLKPQAPNQMSCELIFRRAN